MLNKYSMEKTLGLVQEVYDNNKPFFVKMRGAKDIYRFLFDHPEIKIYVYAMIKNDEIIAGCLYISDLSKQEIPTFSLSYAVLEKYRNKGICSYLVQKSLDYFWVELKTKLDKYQIITFVALDNKISQKISKKFISTNKSIIIDSMTGEKQYKYLKLFKHQ